VKERDDGRTVRLDLKVFTSLGERINVEIQLVHQYDIPERILYYWSRMFSTSIHSGEPYTKLPPTIVISILNYPLFPTETDRFHTIFHILEDEEHFMWSHLLEFHAFDLSAFMVQWKKYRKKVREQNHLEIPWLMMLSAADYRKKQVNSGMLESLEEWAMDIEQVREALIQWENLSPNKENLEVYEARLKELCDLLSNFEGYHKRGLEEGIEIGEEKRSKEIARKMRKKGKDISEIVELTGLSEEEIRKL